MDGDKARALVKPLDLCSMTPLRRQQVRDSWRAEPKTHELPSILTPRLVRKTPFGLSVPALKAKCSPHTELLAVPRIQVPQMHYTTRAERELQKELEEEMTKEELKWLHRKIILPTPTGVSKAALSAKISPRVETMALARLSKAEELSGASKKHKKKQRSIPSHFPLPGKSRKKKSETRVCGCAESIKRIHFGTGDSKKPILNSTKTRFFEKLSPQQRNFLQRNIEEHYSIFRTNYPPDADKIYVLAGGSLVHATCTGKLKLPPGRRHRCLCELNKTQRKNFRRRMKLMGLPKQPTVQDKGPDRGPKKKIKEFEPWLTIMSTPRYNVLNEKPYDPFKVKSSAKFYEPTERILIMSKPREVPPPPPLTDFEGNELPPRREWSLTSRKRIVASARTIELSTPRFVKKKAAEDVKDDPFAVLRRALTAYCSPRTAELAEPKRR